MAISIRERYEHRKGAFTVCCSCHSRMKPVPDEPDYPLCPTCRAFLANRTSSEAFLRDEIEMLRNRKNKNLLFVGLLLHDIQQLNNLLAQLDREDEIDDLREESDRLVDMIGFSEMSRVYYQLARLLSHEGHITEADELFRESISFITSHCLLCAGDFNDWDAHLSNNYWELAMLNQNHDEEVYQWALRNSLIHARMDYERSAEELHKREEALTKAREEHPDVKSNATNEPFEGNYAATLARVYVDLADSCSEDDTDKAVRYYKKAKVLYESMVFPFDEKVRSRLACVNRKLAWVLGQDAEDSKE